jgi:N-acetylglucosaminyl-diphospho-decaprenol L-rhamnosyltransferase
MSSSTPIPIIIVSYCNPEDVVECLTALQGLTADRAFDIYLCENGGTAAFDNLLSSLLKADGTCKHGTASSIRKHMPQFVRVRYLRLSNRDARVVVAEATENFGYGGAINAWLRVLLTLPGWSGVWILNPDTRPEPRALTELVGWSAARGRGMVGSRVVIAGQPGVVQTRGLRWRRVRASTEGIDKFAPTAVEPNPDALEAYIEAPSGVSIYVTRGCIERIGLMDEQYFLYFEDLDWGYRAKKSCGIGYAHRSVVAHHGGTTIGSGTSRATASPLSVYLEFRNRVNFVRQHHRSWIIWTLFILVFRSLEYGVMGAFINTRVALMGLKAGAARETGRPDSVFDFHSGGTPNLRKRCGLNRCHPDPPMR